MSAPSRPAVTDIGSRATFRSFANRGYALLWLANLLSYTPRWMQLTLATWLILELTDSPWLVALVGFFSSMPMLVFGLLGGVLADRVRRQRLLVLLQSANVAFSLLLTLVLAAGVVRIWHVYMVILITGASWALGSPARRALIFDLLGTTDITNAVALDSVGMNVSRMCGPAFAGVLITTMGVTGGFVVVTLIYAVGLLLLWLLRVTQRQGLVRRQQNLGRNVVEGLRYVRQEPMLQAVICITIIMNFLLFPYMQMVPIVARDVLHVDPILMGFLQGGEGFGALVGSLWLASAATIRYHGRVYLVGSIVCVLALLLFSISRWYIVSFPILFILGLGSAGFGTMQSTIVMLVAKEEMRGRALGVVSLAIGAGPLGSLALGAMADAISPIFALRMFALLGMLALGLTTLFLPVIADRTQPSWLAPSRDTG